MYSLKFIIQGCPWYMGPQWLAPLREICSNLTQKKHELVWKIFTTKQKSFRLKVPKASYQDTALDDLWIQTHTHCHFWGWSRCECKSTWVLCTHKKHFFTRENKFFSLAPQHEEVLLCIVIITLGYKIRTQPTKKQRNYKVMQRLPGCFYKHLSIPFTMQWHGLPMNQKSRKDKKVSTGVVNGLMNLQISFYRPEP